MTTMTELLREEQLHEEKDLVRGLKSRHIQMIAIGGAIGVGLFLGSARAIQVAGPALLLSYAFVGIVIFFIMRALGELLLYRPVAGSFATYAEEFVGPWAGFFTGWTYWFMWVVTGMAEITAVAVYVNYWFPEVPHWIPALVTLGVLYGDQPDRRGLLRRVRVLVCDHQGGDDHRVDRHRPRHHPVRRRRAGPDVQASPTCGRTAVLFPMGVGGGDSQPDGRGVRLPRRRAGRRHRGRGRESREGAPERDQRRGVADPDLLHRRPGRHHVARPLEPARPHSRARSSWCSTGSASRRRGGSSTSS